MRLKDILSLFSEDTLDQLARDKIDEVANIRLPRPVLEQEIASALSSFSYIAGVLAASHPPTYAFLKLLMESEDHTAMAGTYRQAVIQRTDRITQWISSGEGLQPRKDYRLYRAMLVAAWQADHRIDVSEARMLEALRDELGITMREHLLLEHHPEVRPVWDSHRAYENARNYLLARGLVLPVDDRYMLPDEVRIQVRRYWSMELHDADYRDLLDQLTGKDLRGILEHAGLPLSGSKAERIERIVEGLVAPSFALDCLHIDQVRDLCRALSLPVSLPKAELVAQLVGYWDRPRAEDNEGQAVEAVGASEEADAKGREALTDEQFERLLRAMSGNELYEVLASVGLPRSGSKATRVERIVQSGLNEKRLLEGLRRRDLKELCRQLGHQVSGPKDELIDRILTAPARDAEAETDEAGAAKVATQEHEDAEPELGTDETTAHDSGDEANTAKVSGLDNVRQDYPSLQRDGQIMLALLKEARSLNERDIQRLASRHDLGWMLAKGHMAELLHVLALADGSPVRVRSTGAANIYEWVEEETGQDRRVGRWAARDVIDALRHGVVPEKHLDLLVVGQEAARSHLQEQLEYVETGRSAFKFIRGAYGSGKSFTTAWLRELALSNGFAVSTVRVSAELSLADLTSFYTGMIEGLRTPEKRGASSLTDILEAWLLGIQRKTERVEGLMAADPNQRDKLIKLVQERVGDELSHLAAHDPGLPPAVTALFRARVEGNEEKAMAARAWLGGDRSLSNQALKSIGVRGTLEADQVLPRLRALLEIIGSTHLKGIVILVDELELVRRRPHKRTRDQAYETLRALIDEAGENRLPGCLLVSTGTDTFFDDRRYGLASYEALAHRINPPDNTSNHRSMRQPVIQLEGLSEARLKQVAMRTRELHATAYNWAASERVTDTELDELVSKWTSFGDESIERLPRPFLRQLVHVLDLCQENPTLGARDCFTEPEQDPAAYEAMLDMVSD